MTKKNQKSSGGGKKISLAILFMMLIAAGACAIAGYTFYEMKNLKAGVAAENTSPLVKSEPVLPVYVPMDTFTVSMQPTQSSADRVLYVGLTLRVRDDNSKKIVEQFLPEVRSRLFILLAHQTAENLSTDEGKHQLIEKIKSTVSKPLAPDHSAVVTDVLFNAFIIR